MTLSSKLGKFSVALVLWALSSLLWMSEFHLFAIFSVVTNLVALGFQDRVKLGRKQMGAVAVVALLLCFFSTRLLNYEDNGYFVGIGTMSLAFLAAWLLAISLLLRKTGYMQRAPVMLSCSVLIACSMSTAFQYVIVISGVAIFLLVFSLREAAGLDTNWRTLPPLLLSMLLMLSLAAVATWSESKVSYLMRLFALTPPTGIRFPPTVSLSSLQRWNNSDVVVLRGYGDNPPLYLIGRSFSEYQTKGFWKWSTDKVELRPEDQVLVETSKGLRGIGLFEKSGESAGPNSYFTIEFPKAGRGFTIFAPRHHAGIAADLERIHRYGDGRLEVLARDDYDGEYFLFPKEGGWQSPGTPEELSSEKREQYLQLPDDLPEVVTQLGEEVAGKSDVPKKKAALVTGFFQKEFTYGYDYPFESSDTALEEFLTKRPPAHCEFFATSAALMLRTQGVPTRYINGFVLQEKSLTGGYYVIRLKHAHAWIEVYLDGQGWVTFDPTPPGTLDSPETRSGLGEAMLEWFSNQWRRLFNFFSLSPTDMLERIKGFLSGLSIFDYLKLAVFFGLIWALERYRKNRGKKKKKKSSKQYLYSAPRDELLSPLLDTVTESLHPPLWQRSAHETPEQWLARLGQSDLDSTSTSKLQEFCRRYSRLRFGATPSKEEISELQKESESLALDLKEKTLEAKAQASSS